MSIPLTYTSSLYDREKYYIYIKKYIYKYSRKPPKHTTALKALQHNYFQLPFLAATTRSETFLSSSVSYRLFTLLRGNAEAEVS